MEPKKFNFPNKKFEKTKVIMRSFQPSWFEKWPWLHYNESEDSVLCHTYAKASHQQ